MKRNKRLRATVDNTTNADRPARKKQKSDPNHFDASSKPANDALSLGLWQTPRACMSWLVSSHDNEDELNDFLAHYWCKKHFVLNRNDRDYYKRKGIDLDLTQIYKIVGDNELEHKFKFGQHLICKYFDKNKQTDITTDARGDDITLQRIQSLFQESGATIQFLHPQFYHYEVAHLVFALESYFGNFVGSNVYVTPQQHQGLKPHWDDIEAFILQIKGRKKWTLYKLKNSGEQWPIEQSYADLDIKDTDKYELLMQCTLSPGDLLYFPRGTIHFAECVPDEEYSLHITISTQQQYTYGAFLKSVVNKCVDRLVASEVDLRGNLPINVIRHIGDGMNVTAHDSNHSNTKTGAATVFNDKMSAVFSRMKRDMFGVKEAAETDIDRNKWSSTLTSAVAECMEDMATQFVTRRYPPVRFLAPDQFILFGDAANEHRKKHEIEPAMKAKDELIEFVEENDKRGDIINVNSEVRLVDPHWMRIIVKKESAEKQRIESFLDDDEGDDVEEEEQRHSVSLYSCVRNEAEAHLMAYEENMASPPQMATMNDVKIFRSLKQQFPDWIKVSVLDAECEKVETGRLCDVLFSLWADGLLESRQTKQKT